MVCVIDHGSLDARGSVAFDAAIFAALEQRGGPETLRIWESRRTAVVVGFSAVIERQVDEPACLRDQVPILRRGSGGGAVVLAPGCLNYSLFLSLEARPELRDVSYSYAHLLGRVIDALRVPGLALRGTTDIAIFERKVSGNAQRRGCRTLLHHGTFLYGFDLPKMGRYLKEPGRQPDYRDGRSHIAFVENMPSSAGTIKDALIGAFGGISSIRLHQRPAFTSRADLPARDGFK
jgi:lipoate-protein ligase A